MASLTLAGTTPTRPALPLVFLDTHWQTPSGRSIAVNAGGDLQAAINAAVGGDEIVLQAGARFTGNFVLPTKSGSGRITIRSSQLTALPEGARVGPAQAASMASIVSPNSTAVFTTGAGASFYRLAGLEITVQDTVTLNYGLVVLDEGSSTSLAQLPSDIIVDRSYIHGNPVCNCRRGVALNGIREAVIDSYISEIHVAGQDSQAIGGWAGPGPYKIVNNYLEGAGENVMFGGALPLIANIIPSDIEIRRNQFAKPLTWMTLKLWTVKNLFELKNASRILVDGNLMENNWVNAQAGWAVLFQGIPGGNIDTWVTVQDLTFTNNIIRHSSNGVDFCGGCWYSTQPDPGTSRIARVYFANNLLDDINGPAYDGGTGQSGGLAFQILANASDLTIEHNTALDAATLMVMDGPPSPRVSFTNNIASHGAYGIFGSNYGIGNPAIAYYLPDSTIVGNLIVGLPADVSASVYPAGNLFPSSMTAVGFTNYNGGNSGNYQLTSTSPYRSTATDGRDPGADINALNSALQGSVQAQSTTVAITSPTSSSTFSTSSSTINLGGTAFDTTGITQVSWTTDHGASGFATGTANWTINGFVLPAGSTRVTVTARNVAGQQASAAIALTLASSDATPPTIAIASPTTGSSFTTSSNTINIGGTASDNVGVAQVTWITDKGGSGIATGTTSWTINGLVLASGSTGITVTAHDAAGNVASAILNVTYTATVTTPPTISITSPTAGPNFTAPSSSINLSGTAADNVGVNQVTWVSNRGGSGIATGTGSWTINGLVLASGTTGVTVTAHDAAGNVASAILNINYAAPDTTPPNINITSPTSGPTYTATGSSPVLSGTASDDVGVAQVTWSTDHGSGGIATGTTNWMITGLVLQSGTTQVTVTAGDAAGNATSKVLTITYTPSDTVAPTVSISSPSSSTFSSSSNTIALAGAASDNTGVTQVTWVTDRGASGTATGTTSWAVSAVPLQTGQNTITVSARDAAGNRGTAALVVTYTAISVNAIAITSPTSSATYHAPQNTVNLGGTAPSNTTLLTWASDQGGQGQATGTAAWSTSGIPLQKGSNRITVTAHDPAGNLSTAQITVLVSHPGIVNTTLPSGKAGKLYSYQLSAVDATPPLTWSADSLPEGLQMSAAGTVTGTPTTTGAFTLNVAVQDSLQGVATAAVRLEVDTWLSLVSSASLAPGPVAPASMVTSFGWQLATTTASSTTSPLPPELGGCTVTVRDANGADRPAPLFYVSASQINFDVPADTAAGPALVTVRSGDQVLATGNLYVVAIAPALFFMNQDGLAAAGLVRVQGNTVTYEQVVRFDDMTQQFVAVPIDLGADTDQVYLTLYGTGFRGRSSLDSVHLYIGDVLVPVSYAGPSGTFDGLDIINALLPQELRGKGTADVLLTVNDATANVVRVVIK